MLLLDAVCVCKVWVGGVIDWVSTHQGSFSVEAARNVCFWTLVCISFKKIFLAALPISVSMYSIFMSPHLGVAASVWDF